MNRKYPLNKIHQYTTLPECLSKMAPLHKDNTAVTIFNSRRELFEYSYQQLSRDICAFAKALTSLGLSRKHIAIISENRYEWLVAFWAVGCIGSVTVAIDVEQTAVEICRMLDHADVQAAVVSGEFISLTEESTFSAETIISMDYGENDLILSFWECIRKSSPCDPDDTLLAPVMAAVKEDDLALLINTSGTTSASKLVMLSHGNLLHNACNAQALVTTGDRVFTPLPLYHTYSLVCGAINVLTHGQNICINGNLKTLMEELKLFSPTLILSVPMITETLLKSIHLEQKRCGIREEAANAVQKYEKLQKLHLPGKPYLNDAVKKVLGENATLIISGGAHMNEEISGEFQAYGITVLQGYGITECSPLVSVNRNKDNRYASVGLLLPEMEVKFSNGEILIKGPSVFKGYYKNPQMTKKTFEDGWFRTGDLGYMDRKGHLYISGRKKNLIVFSNGKKVVPEELEKRILKLPLVKEAMVYGASNGKAADDVKLSVIIYADSAQTHGMSSFQVLEQIQEEVLELNHALPTYMRIYSIKISETEFRKTSIQKLKRGDTAHD